MAEEVESKHEVTTSKFGSFAVLDLETSNLPQFNFNKVSITELSIYGFAASELLRKKQQLHTETTGVHLVPESPRVLHKLTLMLNSRMMIHPDAENITKLDNYMLEEESHFDENAGHTLLGFLKHLQSPVCLVAHNGWNFDFPILKKTFDKINMNLAADIYCVDSLRAFYEIDLMRPISIPVTPNEQQPIISTESANLTKTEKVIKESNDMQWQRAQNETTPKRPTLNSSIAGIKRKLLAEVCSPRTPEQSSNINTSSTSKSRRCLFPSSMSDSTICRNRYPPRGVYKLSSIYERIFQQPPAVSHYAEADVMTLMKLMLHYGDDFLEFTNQRARLFAEVKPVGVQSMF